MSILIEKITLPKYNPNDPLYTHIPACICVYPDGTAKLNILIPQNDGRYMKDPNDYSIREIPQPHGNLVDVSALKYKCKQIYHPALQRPGAYHKVCYKSDIDSAPVIIEAEE